MSELPVFMFTPDLGGLLSFVVTLLLPILVGVVTTRVTSSTVKGVLLLALAAITVIVESALRAIVGDVPWNFIPVLMNVGISFLVGVAMHLGLYKPTGLSAHVQENVGVKQP